MTAVRTSWLESRRPVGRRRHRRRRHGRRRHLRGPRAVRADRRRRRAHRLPRGRLVALLTARSYSLLSRSYPSRGGTVTFVNRAFGPGLFCRRDQRAALAQLHRDARPVLAGVRQLRGELPARRLTRAGQAPLPDCCCSPHHRPECRGRIDGRSSRAIRRGDQSRHPAAVRRGRHGRGLGVPARARAMELSGLDRRGRDDHLLGL